MKLTKNNLVITKWIFLCAFIIPILLTACNNDFVSNDEVKENFANDGTESSPNKSTSPEPTSIPKPTETLVPTKTSTPTNTPTAEPTPTEVVEDVSIEQLFAGLSVENRTLIAEGTLYEIHNEILVVRVPITPDGFVWTEDDILIAGIQDNFVFQPVEEIVLSGSGDNLVKVLVSKANEGYIDILISADNGISYTEVTEKTLTNVAEYLIDIKPIQLKNIEERSLIEEIINPEMAIFIKETQDVETLLQLFDFKNYWNESAGNMDTFLHYYEGNELYEKLKIVTGELPEENISSIDLAIILRQVFPKLGIPRFADDFGLTVADVMNLNSPDPVEKNWYELITNTFKRDVVFNLDTRLGELFIYGATNYSHINKGDVVFPSNEELMQNPNAKTRLRIIGDKVFDNDKKYTAMLVIEMDTDGKIVMYSNSANSEKWDNLTYLRGAIFSQK